MLQYMSICWNLLSFVYRIAPEILNELGEVTDWMGLGAQLDISDDKLQQIEHEYPHTQDHLKAVINHCISSKPRNSWAVLSNALERCGYRVLSGRLHGQFFHQCSGI